MPASAAKSRRRTPVTPSPAPAGPMEAAVRVLLVVASGVFLATYVVMAAIRLRYPFELEWMEGATVDHVQRLLSGKLLYVAPSMDFVPYIYTPLYYYVSAAVAKLTGIGFVPLRLVSILSSLGCCAVLYLLATRETKSKVIGVVAVGLFAATYRLSDAWWDIGRVDSLFLFLLLLGLSLLRGEETGRRLFAAGVVLWLAYLTKQQALVASAPVLAVLVWQYRRRVWPLLAGLLLPLLLGNVLLDRVHGGWFSYYTLALPRQPGLYPPMLLQFWFGDLLPLLAPALLLAGSLVVLELRRGDRAKGWFYLAALVGALGASWLSRLHVGGHVNVLMPGHAVLALAAALGLHSTREWLRKEQVTWRPIAASAVCLVQFGLLVYNPLPYLPTEADVAAGQRLVATLSSLPGDVYLPDHGFLSHLAGKPMHAQSVAVWDVTRGDPCEAQIRLRAEMKRDYEHHRFSAVIVDSSNNNRFLHRYYRKERDLFDTPKVFRPVCGNSVRPSALYLPK